MLADCAGGSMRPLKFWWSARVHEIETVNARWIDRQGEAYSLHYSVQVSGQTYYLHFDGKGVQWWVDEVIFD